ncbi:3-dehydroquinate synthase [Tepidibacter hydrothermalis]|uniref:3-dehydroquinate synthase n=1 Tax=Tepidibacter hydrothermalis TaxID=3036126 RepID=A0ABY8E8F5_9FIRM|nr:3-dehydroquinate synthase [Tepidibacter hydrothermalis]WFD09188.1 3-dehydroquinate synthase [Tepidibacter hydrothermalis]
MENGYKVYIKKDFSEIDIKKDYDKVLIITDENVKKLYMDNFIRTLNFKNIIQYIIEPGENSKTLNVYEDVFKFCIENEVSRKSLIIALGGGVVGDLSGFIASTYMRGIDLIHCPTTLLSQVDSSIGGKTGINLGNYKNIIGSFYRPEFIHININTLKTLKHNEFLSGLSEVIKYALICDYEFLDYLLNNKSKILNLDEECLTYIVKKCSNIKIDVVKKDEKESGIRKTLNLGHTFGHGIEKLGNLSHGFAVAIGTHIAFRLSYKKGYINKSYYEKALSVYKAYNIPISFNGINSMDILKIMKKDKKNSFSKINLVLPTGHSSVEVVDNIDEEEILYVIQEVGNEF